VSASQFWHFLRLVDLDLSSILACWSSRTSNRLENYLPSVQLLDPKSGKLDSEGL
jgi:hypothetical protein